MIVTRRSAKRMIQSVYGKDFKFRITTTKQVGVHPVCVAGIKRTLAWRALATGTDSAVEVLDLSMPIISAEENTLMWSKECAYIANETDRIKSTGRASDAFNGSTACFIRYCIMQRNAATKDKRDDSASYIQHCIDDLTPESSAEMQS